MPLSTGDNQVAALSNANAKRHAVMHVPGSWLIGWCLRALIESEFKSLDADHTGRLSIEELYTGIILIYMKLSMFIRLSPPTRSYVRRLLQEMDKDHDGRLNREEFQKFVEVLSAGMLTRALFQVVVMFVVGPLLARQENRFLTSERGEKIENWIEARTGVQIADGTAERMLVVFNVAILVPLVLMLTDIAYLHFYPEAGRSLSRQFSPKSAQKQR
jgi:hypothetical protein